MLSRVADTIFWLGRYLERTNGVLNAVRINYIASQDGVKNFTWKPLLLTYGDLTSEEFAHTESDSSRVLDHLVFEKMNAGSAFNNVVQGRENARSVQDHITKEVWQCLNDYYHFIRDPEVVKQVVMRDPVSGLDQLIKYGLLFNGTVKNTMTRDESYTYLHLGKFLERALLTVDILRIKLTELNYEFNDFIEASPLRYLLYSLFGYEVFMKTYKGDFSPDNVLELVLYNTHFPHSLIYCLTQLNKYFERLKPDSIPESYDELEYLIGKTMNNVKYSNVAAIQTSMLNGFLLQIRSELINIGSAFGRYYFNNT